MRILVLSDLWVPFPGGAERLLFNVARDLRRRGHDVLVVTGYEHAQPFDGPEVVVDLDLPLTDAGGVCLLGHIAAFAPDVIVTHHIWARHFSTYVLAAGVPVVQVVLNGPRLPEAALAVYISEWVRDRAGTTRPEDLVLTPPAFDDVVAIGPRDAIGFVKPLPHKGVELVYKIARRLRDRRFVILRGEWQDLERIQELPNIEFLEPVVDMRDFWARIRVVLMPSLSEDAGTVAQEATRNGVPCISSDVEGLRETNGGGIRLPTDNVSRWINAIRILDNPTQYQRVVERQRAHLDSLDHAGTLDELAARIAGL